MNTVSSLFEIILSVVVGLILAVFVLAFDAKAFDIHMNDDEVKCYSTIPGDNNKQIKCPEKIIEFAPQGEKI